MISPYNCLDTIISKTAIKPQKIQIRSDKLQTLNDFQKLLGDINWLRPKLGIATYQLQNLYSVLQGYTDLNSPQLLTKVNRN